MRNQSEIEKVAADAAELSLQRSKVPGMTYEQGVSAALDWVLENVDENPLEE